MKKKMLYFFFPILLILISPLMTHARMESSKYVISNSSLSGPGGPMTSGNYQTNSTLGQPSPLMDPNDPPDSTSYELYPGFWYILEAEIPGCQGLSSFADAYGSTGSDSNYNEACDSEDDGDVDGADLDQKADSLGL
jgi:hypothetical protein